MRNPHRITALAAALLISAACGERRAAPTAAKAPSAPAPTHVALAPVAQPKTVQVQPVGRDGKPIGPAQTVQLTAERNPADVGMTPVPSGSQ